MLQTLCHQSKGAGGHFCCLLIDEEVRKAKPLAHCAAQEAGQCLQRPVAREEETRFLLLR